MTTILQLGNILSLLLQSDSHLFFAGNKYVTVLIVLAIILVGIILILINLERRISKFEKENNHHK